MPDFDVVPSPKFGTGHVCFICLWTLLWVLYVSYISDYLDSSSLKPFDLLGGAEGSFRGGNAGEMSAGRYIYIS